MAGPRLRRVGVVVNPVSGRGRAGAVATAMSTELSSAGHTLVELSAATAAGAETQARAAVLAGQVDVLAVVGGDGTVHLGTNACAGTGIPLAIVACGSGNDSARGLGLPRGDPVAMARLISVGTVRTIDAGCRATPAGPRYWLGVLGAGFDSVVTERVLRMRRLHGRVRYLAAVARELPTFHGIPYAVEVDGERVETDAMLVAVANGRSFGSGMLVCPDAVLDDGLFDVLILHHVGRAEFVRIFPLVFSGRHVGHPAVEIRRGRQVRLEADGIQAQADGERFGALPLELHVAPGAVQVVVP
ncbi:MAG: diacylglycerol/lipid kinase family protein [Dermatophilaceae bacterium]